MRSEERLLLNTSFDDDNFIYKKRKLKQEIKNLLSIQSRSSISRTPSNITSPIYSKKLTITDSARGATKAETPIAYIRPKIDNYTYIDDLENKVDNLKNKFNAFNYDSIYPSVNPSLSSPIENQFNNINSQLYELFLSLNNTINMKDEEIEELKKENSSLKDISESLKNELKKAETELAKQKKNFELNILNIKNTQKFEIGSLKKDLAVLQSSLTKEKNLREEEKKNFECLKEKVTDYCKNIRSLQRTNACLRQEIDDFVRSLEGVKEEIDALRQNEDEYKETVKSRKMLFSLCENLKKENKKKDREIQRLEERLERAKKDGYKKCSTVGNFYPKFDREEK